MSDPRDLAFGATSERIGKWRRPLLLSHTKPDGDAIGALVAMRDALRHRGLDPATLVFDPIPDRYQFLVDQVPIARLGENITLSELDSLCLDGVIVLDTCSYNQLEPVAEWLRATALPKVVFDHHVTRDDVADTYLIDESASATCLILYEWLIANEWTIDPGTAEALFVGIATDTGWFRHSNTDARSLTVAAELVGLGVQPFAMFDALFQHESAARFRLRADVQNRLELRAAGRLALLTLPASIFSETGATLADTEDLVNDPLRIDSTIVSVMLVEQGGGVVRCGFRSRAPIDASSLDIDVAAVAAQFGGGGHRRAAGARMNATLNDAKEQVVEALAAKLE